MGKMSLLLCSQQQTFLPFTLTSEDPLCVGESSLEKGCDFQLPCSVYYPLWVVQVGRDEADERNTRIAKRNLQALGCLLGQMGAQVVFLVPLVTRDEYQKELENPSGAIVEFWGFQSWGGLYGIRHAG